MLMWFLKNTIFFIWLINLSQVTNTNTFKSFKVPEQEEKQSEEFIFTPEDKSQHVEEMVLDLDLPPSDRWSKIIHLKKPQIIALINYMNSIFGSISRYILFKLIKPCVQFIPNEYLQEIQGIAKQLNIDEMDMIAFNIFYEIYTVCTSIITADEHGDIYHVRSMDFGLFLGWDWSKSMWILPDYLKNITLQIIYKKNNKVIARAVHFASYVGVLTGSKPNCFSISLNQRFGLDGGMIGLFMQWFTGKRSNFIGMFLRDTLLKANTYDSALDMIMTYDLIAPSYIVIGGINSEGAIVSRSRRKVDDIWKIDVKNKVWYLLQTNSDHWSSINLDGRKLPGYKLVEKMGQQNVNLKNLYNVLDTMPLRNKLSVFNTFMSAKYDKFSSYLKYCNSTCPIW